MNSEPAFPIRGLAGFFYTVIFALDERLWDYLRTLNGISGKSRRKNKLWAEQQK
jgi:uncharacterized membrane protein